MPTTRTDLRRLNPKRPQKQHFLILHEPGLMGEYLAWVRRIVEHPNADLMVVEDGESLEAAFKRVDSVRSDSGHKQASYTQTWAIIDSSKRPEPIQPPSTIKLVRVSPNFESWIVGHFRSPDGVVDPLLELQAHFEGFAGSLRHKENTLFGRFDAARAHEVREGAGPTLCDLVDAMRESQRQFRGHDLPVTL